MAGNVRDMPPFVEKSSSVSDWVNRAGPANLAQIRPVPPRKPPLSGEKLP
jgi:hypothetical protein